MNFDSRYRFDLPRELIALHPADRRDESRLLGIDPAAGAVRELGPFRSLVDHLAPGDLLVLNDTRVYKARLRGQRRTGGHVEALLLERGARARALVRPLTKLKPGEEILFAPYRARLAERHPDGSVTLDFGDATAGQAADDIGEMPIPPYLKRAVEPLDTERYQTVYANRPGAVAAPTAGFHFTPALLAALAAKGVRTAFLTLDVGYGTFAPVKPGQVALHKESYRIPAETLAIFNAPRSGRLVAVGTTVVRALETFMQTGRPEGETDIFIRPGFRFRLVEALITNFHLPESSLLMLTHAFAGDILFEAYRYAVERRFRFFSYGDACFISSRPDA